MDVGVHSHQVHAVQGALQEIHHGLQLPGEGQVRGRAEHRTRMKGARSPTSAQNSRGSEWPAWALGTHYTSPANNHEKSSRSHLLSAYHMAGTVLGALMGYFA